MEIIESKKFDLIASLTEEVQNLHAELFPSVYKRFEREQIGGPMEKILGDDQCRVFVALVKGKAVGYIIILIRDIAESAFHYGYRLVHIDQLVVSAAHRHTGIGSALMDKAETFAREQHIGRIELDHLFVNEKAAQFFAGKGFGPYRQKRFKTID